MSNSVPAVKRFVGVHPANIITPAKPSIVITDSQHYTRFAFQIIGFTPAITLLLEGSLDGTTWSPLSADNYWLPALTTDSSGLIFSVDVMSAFPGGLRIRSNDNSAAAGTVLVQMSSSPFNTNR